MQRNISTFYLYKLLVSFQLFAPIYVIYLLSNNLTMTKVMLLQSLYTFLIFLLEIPSGAFADRFGRKTSLALSSLFLAITFTGFGFASTFPAFAFIVVLWAIAQSLRSGSDLALLYDSMERINNQHLYPRASGRANSIEMLTLGLSSVLGGVIASYTQLVLIFFLTAFVFFFAFITALFFKEPHRSEFRYWQHIKSSAEFSLKNKIVNFYILFFAFYGSFAFLLYYLIQPFFEPNGEIILGVAVAGYFLFCSLGAFVAEKFIHAGKNLAWQLLLTSAVIFFLIPIVPFYLALVLVFFNSFLSGVGGILAGYMINRNTSKDMRATVLSVLNLLQKLIFSLFAPLAGYAADLYSLSASFFISAAMLLIFSSVIFTRTRFI